MNTPSVPVASNQHLLGSQPLLQPKHFHYIYIYSNPNLS